MRNWRDRLLPEDGPMFVCRVGIVGRAYLEKKEGPGFWLVCSPDQDLCEVAYAVMNGRVDPYRRLFETGRIRLTEDLGTVPGSRFQYIALSRIGLIKEWICPA
jgi:hypothetical protein